ncbi:predicted protein [Aspergillus terreus NIH2624]|uniref:Uncharacterized protein n=1 Tax=Aspergillus terreus (strain NIH 2624 / FGSC A1156) TaxID=341663 RepID=Q0C7U4_ASPTN|nr:uncharacterized protein ATEG_10240 [Aspergillus terreus NIH2624]EAU29237.1 predicted protein [Aspergillus terreus NIH2624]
MPLTWRLRGRSFKASHGMAASNRQTVIFLPAFSHTTHKNYMRFLRPSFPSNLWRGHQPRWKKNIKNARLPSMEIIVYCTVRVDGLVDEFVCGCARLHEPPLCKKRMAVNPTTRTSSVTVLWEYHPKGFSSVPTPTQFLFLFDFRS